ncbi:hypothetical protein Tco_0461244 [Tanacetum coccineum]
MEAYFQNIESLMTILASLDSPVSDEDVVHYALVGLPNKYDQVCGYMHYKDVFPDLKTAHTLLITEEMRLKTKANALLSDSSSPMVFVAESGNSHRSSPTPHVNPWKPCFNFAKGTLTQPSPAAYYVSPNPGPTYFQPAQYHNPSTPPGFGLPFSSPTTTYGSVQPQQVNLPVLAQLYNQAQYPFDCILSMPNMSPPGVTNTLSAHQVSSRPAVVSTGAMGSATVPG